MEKGGFRVSNGTALRNHNRIVLEEMSSGTPLTILLGIKTTFYTIYISSKYVRIFIIKISNFNSD